MSWNSLQSAAPEAVTGLDESCSDLAGCAGGRALPDGSSCDATERRPQLGILLKLYQILFNMYVFHLNDKHFLAFRMLCWRVFFWPLYNTKVSVII